MKIVQEQILFDCLEQFEAGVSAEALMAKYPHAAAEIEKFLMVAAHLPQARVQPSLAARQQSQKLFLQQAAQLRAEAKPGWFSWRGLQRTLLPLASMAMVTVLLGVTFLFASASAVPGDLLYDTKRWAEMYQLQRATDATAVFNLQSQQNTERVRELKSLLRTNETAVVAFEGLINTKQGNNWIIAGISVQVTGQTRVDDGAELGARVWVNGRTEGGQLFASQITVLQAVPTTNTPSPTATAWQTPTVTASPTPTTAASQTPAATSTSRSPATATPTKTTTPMATATVLVTTPATGTPTSETPGAPTVTLMPTTDVPDVPTATIMPSATFTAMPNPTTASTATKTPTAVPPTPTSPPPPTSTPTPGNGNDNGNDNDNDNGNDNDNDNGNDNDNRNEN